MANFPTISRRGSELHSPVVGDFKDKLAHDPTIRSSSDGGYVTSRAKFTRIPRKWDVHYMWLTVANKNTLKTFVDATAIGGAESFSWLNPEDGVTYTARFLDPLTIEFNAHPNTNFLFWMVDFIMEEV